MKRYLKYIIFIMFIPVLIFAKGNIYCSEEEYKKELDKVKGVLASPSVTNVTKEYTEYKILFNVQDKQNQELDYKNPNFYGDYNKMYSYELYIEKSDNLEETGRNIYRIYGKQGIKGNISYLYKLKPNNVCFPGTLKGLDINLLYVNPYSNNKKCKEYPDFKYCAKNIYFDNDDKEIDKLFDKYIEEKKLERKPSEGKSKTKSKQVFKYLTKKNITIITISIISIIFIIILVKSRRKNKLYFLFLIFLIPIFISANGPPEAPTVKRCKYKDLKSERAAWCDCIWNVLERVKDMEPVFDVDNECPFRPCDKCIGFCNGSDGKASTMFPFRNTTPYSYFCPKSGKGGHGMPPLPPIYCCYYKGNKNSKYRFYNDTEKNCDRKNMESIEINEPEDCVDTTCNSYTNFNDKEEFCNEFADTKENPASIKKDCISTNFESYGCNLPITISEDSNPSCNYKASSYGSDVFSAKGRKTRVKTVPYEGIFLKETCDYEENLEMRSMGSRYAFVNTLNVSNGRNCKYEIYNEKGILQNLMATIFRPKNESIKCENNKYCMSIKKFKENNLNELLKGNKTGYKSKYSVTGIKGNGSRIFKTYDFKTGDTLKAQSKMSKPKDTGKKLNVLNKVTNIPVSNNIERETTAVTGVTLNMQESCYNFPNNRLGSGECFPAFFSDHDIREVRTNASFNTEGKFLCQGVSKGAYYPSPKNPVDTCTDLDAGLTSGAGVSSDNGRSAAQIGNSEYCEIIVHGHKCDLSPNSNVYDLSYGYRAGLKIRTRFKAKYFNISNECVTRSNTEGMRKSTLKGYKNHIYGGLIDDKGMFYSCKVTLIDGICPPACVGKNCGGGPDGKKCEVNRSGNTYTISSPGINFEKDGLYARKGGRFEESEFRNTKSPDNLKVWRIYENKITSEKSKYIDYYNENVVRMSEPGVNHPIYFMVCPNNNCHNPYLCDSYYIDKTTDLKDPEDPELDKEKPSNPDCITDLEYNERQNADSVRSYCEANFANEYGTDKTLEACLNKCYTPDNAAGEAQVYRRIKYSEPFPNNRTPGWNWFGRETLISESANFVKTNNKNPLWVITLRQSDSYSIRNNNRSAGYDVYSEVPETQGNAFKIYRSKFLESDLRDVKKHEKS